MKPTRLALVLAFLVAGASAASAQIPGTEITQVLASRPQLESLLTRLEDAAQSNVYSGVVREQARRQAAQVRTRLAEGDFHVGDRIQLDVEGDSVLTDTFTVEAGRQVVLKQIGPVPLQGVLRSELSDYITQRLTRFLREPHVRARSLIRVMILGGVVRPGFWTVPVDIPVDAVLQVAGGPGQNADIEKITIERGSEVLFDGERLLTLITQGTTIDAMGIQAGDKFKVAIVPVRSTNPVQRFQAIQYMLALPVSLFALGRLLGF